MNQLLQNMINAAKKLLCLLLILTPAYGEPNALRAPEISSQRFLNPHVLKIYWNTAPENAEQLWVEISTHTKDFKADPPIELKRLRTDLILRPSNQPDELAYVPGFQRLLTKLQPNTSYQIKARYQFPNSEFSTYSTPISIPIDGKITVSLGAKYIENHFETKGTSPAITGHEIAGLICDAISPHYIHQPQSDGSPESNKDLSLYTQSMSFAIHADGKPQNPRSNQRLKYS